MIARKSRSEITRILVGILIAGLVAVLLGFASAPISRSTIIQNLCLSPEVVTHEASEISANTATLNGEVMSLGESEYVAVSFEWGIESLYDNETDLTVMTAPGTFSFVISDLKPITKYNYRSIATNINRDRGKDITFVTLSN